MEESVSFATIKEMRERINDEKYLFAAIQRIAFVLSNELMDRTIDRTYKGGNTGESRRKNK